MQSNSIAVVNGKGGVGKTSITANLAGSAALSGWKVLAIDLDSQANLGRDLGYLQAARTDEGAGLLAAVVKGARLEPLANERPNLDVVPAGEVTDDLVRYLQEQGRVGLGSLDAALAGVAHEYDLVVLDCPPQAGAIQDAALVAAHYLIIPTSFDAGSIDGLSRVASRFQDICVSENPALELLGVVLFGFGVRDKRIVAEVRTQLEAALGGSAPVLETVIRHVRRAAYDMRERGVLAYEYEASAASAPRWYQALREGTAPPTFSSGAGGLAGDYYQLTREVLRLFAERQAEFERAGVQ